MSRPTLNAQRVDHRSLAAQRNMPLLRIMAMTQSRSHAEHRYVRTKQHTLTLSLGADGNQTQSHLRQAPLLLFTPLGFLLLLPSRLLLALLLLLASFLRRLAISYALLLELFLHGSITRVGTKWRAMWVRVRWVFAHRSCTYATLQGPKKSGGRDSLQ